MGPLPLGEPFHYRYSFESDLRQTILAKLGYSACERRILLTENGTNAVLAVANALALIGVRNVVLLSPSYFATEYALRRCGISVRRAYWQRNKGIFTLPPLRVVAGEALWAESPIFGTGVSADQLLSPVVRRVVDEGHAVVLDRSLEVDAGELAVAVQESPTFFTVHAPHKTVCVNGMKFGAATFHTTHYDSFDHWADVLAGGLSLSAEAASRHFSSTAFDRYYESMAEYVSAAASSVEGVVRRFNPHIQIDVDCVGYWRTIYAPEVPAEKGNDREWLKWLVERTGAVPIPGLWTSCSREWGFCFRVNLLRYDSSFKGALHRLVRALAEEKPGQR